MMSLTFGLFNHVSDSGPHGSFVAGPRSAIGRAPESYLRGPGFDTRSGNILSFLLPLFQVVSYWRKYVHEVLVNRLGGLSLPRKSVVRLTDRPDMTLDVYCGRKKNNATTSTKLFCYMLGRQ